MCGIIGCVGVSGAAGALIKGLKGLEYRGYDSGGIGVLGKNGLGVVKAVGEIKNLENKLRSGAPEGSLGIGHTRWATHGAASKANAHPQLSRRFAVVHNGIIENAAELKESLLMSGFSFTSETDTEVIPKLLELNYAGSALEAIKKTLPLLKGSYALGIICTEEPDALYCAKNGSPLLVGRGAGGCFICSDPAPLSEFASEAAVLEDGEAARLTKSGAEFYGADFSPMEKPLRSLGKAGGISEKNGFEHFMLKEIYEQPAAVAATLESVTDENGIRLPDIGLSSEDFRRLSRIYLVGCGSAYHAALMAKYFFEKTALIPCFAEYAGEFRYESPVLDESCLVVIISQSGETADSLAALKLARERGAKTLCVVNVEQSSVSRMSGGRLLTLAGTETAVATTKAFTCQCVMLDMLCLHAALCRGAVSPVFAKIAVDMCRRLPQKIERILEAHDEIQSLADELKSAELCFFLGRNADYAAALEGALKLKEISYINCIGCAASELKHGTISLIEEGTPCIGLIGSRAAAPKTLSNIREVITRGARATLLAPEGLERELSRHARVIPYPDTIPLFAPLLEAVPLQLLAYYTAKEKGLPIDKPRNLAKSVTVE